MLRSSLLTASAIALVAGASAQTTPQTLTAEKVPGAIKHAGIFHVSTGTWTRTGGASANFGPDTIYSNTAASNYFASAGGSGGFAPGSTNYDNGIVPSTANTDHPGANRDEYNVNCVEIGYCDLSTTGDTSWELSFYNSYLPCTFDPAPDTTFDTGIIPQGGCWFVTLDLSGGAEFCLAADGGDGFDADNTLDSFGWSYRYTGTTPGTDPAGFLLQGDPQNTEPNFTVGGTEGVDGTNTYFGPASLCGPDAATGLANVDNWWIEDPTAANSGCFFFGGYGNLNTMCGTVSTPHASWHMELQADTGACGGNVISMPSGCNSNPTSSGANALLEVSGSAAVADNNMTLTAAGITANSFGYFVTSQNIGTGAMPAGTQGAICVGGNLGRFTNAIRNSGAAGEISISTAAGEVNTMAIPSAAGPFTPAAGTSQHFQCWFRDTPAGGVGNNLTDGAVITWQ